MASLIKDVVAFHNSYGGVLLSGIDDSTREVCGDDVGLDGAGLTVEDLRARVTAATGVDIALRYGRFRHAPSGRTVCALFIPQRARFNPPVELKSDSKERKGGDKGDKRPIYVRGAYLRRGTACVSADGGRDWEFLRGTERFEKYDWTDAAERERYRAGRRNAPARRLRSAAAYPARSADIGRAAEPKGAKSDTGRDRPSETTRWQQVGDTLGIFIGFMSLIYVALVFVALWISWKPAAYRESRNSDPAPISIVPQAPPHKVDDRWVVYPQIGTDKSGKSAGFLFYKLDTSYYWSPKSWEEVMQATPSGLARIPFSDALVQLRWALEGRVSAGGRMFVIKDATDLISIGTASNERQAGNSALAEATLAYGRARHMAKAIVDGGGYRGSVWTLNLGQHKVGLDDASGLARQRPVLLVVVFNKDEGVHLGHALANAMHQRQGELPDPEEYREFQLQKFR